MRKSTWGAISAVLAIGVLTSCSPEADKSDKDDKAAAAKESSASADPAKEESKKTSGKAEDKGDGWKNGTRIGNAGTACELPVSFEVAKMWKPKGLSAEDGELISKFMGHKSVRGACEIDAKPAGNIGFMRVWTGDRTDKSPRQVLEDFIGEEKNVTGSDYSDVKAGELPAAEVVYTQKSALSDEPKQQHALAVSTPKGVTVVHLGGLDNEEHKEMLPAYELAKKSMVPVA